MFKPEPDLFGEKSFFVSGNKNAQSWALQTKNIKRLINASPVIPVSLPIMKQQYQYFSSISLLVGLVSGTREQVLVWEWILLVIYYYWYG